RSYSTACGRSRSAGCRPSGTPGADGARVTVRLVVRQTTKWTLELPPAHGFGHSQPKGGCGSTSHVIRLTTRRVQAWMSGEGSLYATSGRRFLAVTRWFASH